MQLCFTVMYLCSVVLYFVWKDEGMNSFFFLNQDWSSFFKIISSMEWYIVQTNEDFSENMNKGEMVLFIKMLSSIAMDLRDQKDMACVSQLQVWSVVLQGPPNINLDGNPGGLQASPVGPKHQ